MNANPPIKTGLPGKVGFMNVWENHGQGCIILSGDGEADVIVASTGASDVSGAHQVLLAGDLDVEGLSK